MILIDLVGEVAGFPIAHRKFQAAEKWNRKHSKEYEWYDDNWTRITAGNMRDSGGNKSKPKAKIGQVLNAFRNHRQNQYQRTNDFGDAQFYPEIIGEAEMEKGRFNVSIGEITIRAEEHHKTDNTSRGPIGDFIFHV